MTRHRRPAPDRGIRRTPGLAEPPAGPPLPVPPPAHRVVLVVEVNEPSELSATDLVAMADVLREAAAELAPQGTTRASVELDIGTAPPAPRVPPDNHRTAARIA